MPSLREALSGGTVRLRQAGVSDPEREAAWLLAHVLDCSVGVLRARGYEPLAPNCVTEFDRLLTRRENREPVQYILGTEEFMGLTFRVTPAVLIPRLDTEVLVRRAAEQLAGREAVHIADVGTGSGAIAVGLAWLLPQAEIVAVDISPAALAVARENALSCGVADRIQFRLGDLLAPLNGTRFDAIVSNPPYIDEAEWQTLEPEVHDWEPRLALTPGADGLAIYRRLAAEAPAVLNTGAFLAVEVGVGQASAVSDLFRSSGLFVSVHADTAGISRVVLGHKA